MRYGSLLGKRKFVVGEDIPAEIKTLSSACSLHARLASRLWIITATVAFAVIASKPVEDKDFVLLNISIEREIYPYIASILLSCLNIVTCSAYLQETRTLNIFHNLLKCYNAEKVKFTPDDTLADVAHTLYHSTLDRVFPFSHHIPDDLDGIFTFFVLISKIFFYGFSISISAFMVCEAIQYELGYLWETLTITVFITSALASLIVYKAVFEWWRDKHVKRLSRSA